MSETKYWPVEFGPSYTPKEMLTLGVFEGRYIGAIKGDPSIPKDWFNIEKVLSAKNKKEYPSDPKINHYGIKSRQPLSVWRENGWLTKNSPNGWFEWYIKFCLGRRLGNIKINNKEVNEDTWQINRWRSFVARHMGQISAHCSLSDKKCHAKQRQGLLQWAWNSEKDNFFESQVKNNAKRISSELGFTLENKEIAKERVLAFQW